MAATIRAPKQWCLTKTESINSFESWKQNLVYTLSLDVNFAPFLVEGAVWTKKTKAEPLRGFTNNGEDAPETQSRTAQQKTNMLELMLGQIANYCPIISRNTIVKSSTSIKCIWNAIRIHFGFQATGAHFVDFDDIKLQPSERPENLYQRLMAFVEDSLLRSNCNITHHNEQITEDEELSPTMENFIVLSWLRLINPALPKLVKQRYGTELRSRTLASIKPEISQALSSLLDEIACSDEGKVMRTEVSSFRGNHNRRLQGFPFKQPGSNSPSKKSCPLCQQHAVSTITFLVSANFFPIESESIWPRQGK